MSAVEPEKATGTESVEDEDWLYGEDVDNGRDVAEAAGDEDDEKKTETEIFSALVGDVEGVNRVDHQDGDADSNTDSDDNLRVTIGDIKTDRMQSINSHVSLKTSGITTVSGGKVSGSVAVDGFPGAPSLEVEGELEEKPWRRPGADLSDYFNYGFNEDTWKTYCDKQRRLRMSLEFMSLGSSEKSKGHHDEPVSKSDLSSSVCVSAGECRTPKSSIDVIGGQTETIVCVEGQRLNSTDGNSMQVQSFSEHPMDAEPPSSKLPPFFAPTIPPPPFPPLPNTPLFLPHPPRFPLPPEVPPLPLHQAVAIQEEATTAVVPRTSPLLQVCIHILSGP
ncbi:pre-mRNA 3'-end-processing factor FIP1 isoform X2 [Silurus meridionalis]|uniref:Pre-mRNA polyadenylation factor Fip1 domain-containing protein n=1 Tax=Silurus meridionalis TaxID=175797 RepID=A0A8T0AFA8_SILME|nr:pre-mRNA 3'-end-processing factor FIP1 isoform X2 [Silurus meridionalis]KAF7690121.1 hypothetical protein HF521_011925 [Silurus meridionalis]